MNPDDMGATLAGGGAVPWLLSSVKWTRSRSMLAILGYRMYRKGDSNA